ncbi:hypothetical protein PVAND_001394 [Polypedilum vanderplanki]|uniref:Tudor domain-containing protein n=1 Tax=Polypedilum vanderplanki TaxID=319348 RepID=A0A9J6BNC1_POLVA|nr:hypothetical protein PVAND_001394 [Polypedilum vanderplanki]
MNQNEFAPVDLSRYQKDSIFVGSIVSKISLRHGLCYCIDTISNQILININKHKEYEEYDKLPQQKTKFIYYSRSRNTYYRAYRPIDNPASNAIKAILIDTGETVFLIYSKGKFFKITKEFTTIPSLSIPLKIHKFPNRFASISEFINKNLLADDEGDQAVRIKVKVLSVINDVVHVDVIESSYKGQFIKFENTQADNTNILKLTKSNIEKLFDQKQREEKFRYSSTCVMASDINEKSKLPALGSNILINATMVVHPYLIYGQCREINNCLDRNYELMNLMMRLNNFERKHEPLKAKPILNQMVIVSMDAQFENNKRKYYRGKVHEIFGNVLMILFVDYGFIRPEKFENLFCYPDGYTRLPFQSFCIHVSNIEDAYKADCYSVVVEQNLKSFGIGIVEQVNGFDITVKLYNNQAFDMNYILSNHIFPVEKRRKVLKFNKANRLVK